MATTSKKAETFLKIFGTVVQAKNTIDKGVTKAVEGVFDSVATLGAAVTKPFLPNVSQSLQTFVEKDLYSEGFNANTGIVQNVAKGVASMATRGKLNQLNTVDNTVKNIGSTYGQLDEARLPLSKITPVLNDVSAEDVLYQVSNMLPSVALGAGLGQVGSLGFLGLSAAGNASEEAFKEGAGAGQALAYGVASGLVEVGTEKISDAFGLMTGGKGGLLDKIIPSTTIAGRLVKGVGGEAFEEAVSESVNPFLKQIYDKDSISDTFGTSEGLKQYGANILNSAIMGGVTSLAMAPLGSGNIVDDVETSKTLTQRQKSLEASGKLTAEKATKLSEQIAKANANVETKLKKMSETDRANTIQALKLTNYESDGTLKKTYEKAKYATIGTETHDVQQMAKDAGFTLSETLTSEQESNLQKVKKNLYKLQAKGLNTDGIVVVKENQTNANETLAGANNGKVIFVNENRLTELNSALQTLAHESAHSLPGTFATMSLLDAVMNDETNGKAVRDVLDNYDVTQEEWDSAKDAFEKGTATEKQIKIVDETNAAFAENILGNEEAMRVLTRNNEGLVVKAYNSIKDAIKLKQLTGAEKSEYKTMLEYAAAFEDAMTSEGIDFVPMSGDDKDEAKYSVKANDAEYTELAKEPEANKARLQEMVDAAAKNDGYTVKAYHGSEYEGRITSFKGDTDGVTYATDSRDVAKTYSAEGTENIYNVYIDTNGFLTVDTEGGYNRSVKIPDELKDIWYSSRNRTQTNDIVYLAKQKGYKGVIFKNINDVGMHNWEWDENNVAHYPGASTVYAVIGSNNIKSADPVTYDDNGNVIPLSERFNTQNDDIRYSVKKERPIVQFEESDTTSKTPVGYTKDEATSLIDEAMKTMEKEGKHMFLSKSSKAQAVTELKTIINSTKVENRAGYVLAIIERILNNTKFSDDVTMTEWEEYRNSEQYAKDVKELGIMRSYFHQVDMGDIKDNLRNRIHKTEYLGKLVRWNANIDNENAKTIRQIYNQNKSEFNLEGKNIDDDVNLLLAINDRYNELQDKTKAPRHDQAIGLIPNESRNRVRTEMLRIIMDGIESYGDRTIAQRETTETAMEKLKANEKMRELAENAEKEERIAKEEVAALKEKIKIVASKDSQAANLIHAIAKKASELQGMTSRKYAEKHNIKVSALLFKNEEFRSIASSFSDIFKGKGTISPSKVRNKIGDFLNLFGQSQLLKDYLEDYANADEGIRDMMMDTFEQMTEALKEHVSESGVYDQSPLTLDELECINRVLDFTKNIYTSYDSVYQDGVRKSLTEEAKKFETVQSVVKDLHRKKSGKISVKGFAAAASTPIAVAEHMDAYQHGLFTDTVERLTYDTWVRNRNRMNLAKGINKYVAEHKGYRRHLRQYMPVGDVEIQIGEFMDAYFMATQENGQLTLFGQDGGGLTFTGKDKVVTNKGTLFTKEQFESAYQSLDQTDKDFMEMVWDVFQKGGKYIAPTDIAMHGFTLVKDDGNYYQLSRNQSEMNSHAGDASKAGSRVESVLNLKINKKRSTKARKISLQATNILNKTFKYIADVTNYNAYAVDVSNFRRLYNFKLDGDKDTLRRGYDATWDADKGQGSADAYISKLMDDIQGVAKSQGAVMKEISKFRGRFAQAQLGLNLNVVLGQLASYPMALAYLDIDDLAYGVKYFFSKDARADMDNYSVLSAARADSGDAISANTLAEVTSAIGRVEGFLTNAADRATLTCLFEATVHKFTKENPDLKLAEVYEKAADYFDKKVVTRTQPTWQASDRSAWMRSDSEVMKFVMAFRSVPLKQMTEFISSVDRLHVMNQLSDMKLTDAQKAAGVKVDVKGAQKMLARVSVGIVAANVMYAMLKQLVKHITDRDDEEDNNGAKWYEQIANQFFLTTMTMFPLVGDAVAKITPALGGGRLNNYDAFSISIVDEANDLLECINGFWELADNTPQETMRWLKQIVFTSSSFLGLSTRNVWNQVTGIISQLSPSTGETIDSWFYKQSSYAAKMRKAVENGDAKMIDTILQIQSGVDGLPSVYNTLVGNGYVDILPKSVGTTFTYDGETYEMTKAEQAQFREVYTGYAKAVSDMTRTVVFKTATDDVKAKAIKAIQNTYWQMAIDKTVGDETTAKLYVFSKAISIGKLAVITEVCKAYSADKDDDGNSIAGSKKAKVLRYLAQTDLTKAQQALVLAYLGYTDSSSRQTVRAYINSLAITKKEKELLFSMCGY